MTLNTTKSPFFTSTYLKLVMFLILGLGFGGTSRVLNSNGYTTAGYFNSVWPALVSVIIGSYFMIDAHAQWHSKLINKGIWPSHFKASVYRIAVAIAYCLILHAYYHHFPHMMWLLAFCGPWFLIVFNPRLNYHRTPSLPFFYLGKDGKKSSWFDRVFNNFKYGGEVLWFGSFALALYCAYRYITY